MHDYDSDSDYGYYDSIWLYETIVYVILSS